MAKSYFIRTFGCQMNEHDSGRAAGMLETLGYRRAPDETAADLVLVNTCAVRENADNRLYGTLGHLKGLKDQRRSEGADLTIVVGGCLAQKDGDTVARKAPWVDVVYGTHNLPDLPQLLAQADSAAIPVVELVEQLETFPSALPAKRSVRHHAWVSIAVGCNNSCTFCIVPSLRGPERSRRLGDIVEEVRALVADDVVEVTLLGQNVNSYGRDLAGRSQFADLLRELGTVDGLERLRFTSPHPRDFTDEVLEAMAQTPNVCPHLHLPLQSGSDRLLRLMRRSYRARRYLALVERTRELMPDAALTTDIIVGFPGETDEDFQATLDVVAQVGFDQAFTFQYSPRPGTPAAALVDEYVPAEVVRERYGRLEQLTRAQSLTAHQRLLTTRQELLVESPSKTDPSRWSGRTRGNHLVHFPAPSTSGGEPAFAPGDLVEVEILEASANYAIGGPAAIRRRTAAGRAAGAAMARGEGHGVPTDAAPTPGARGLRLPVLSAPPAGP
ncbi:tRNA (N6-isopentenyl adenosine(37)-C2)-methylthiotransferase MiaB [Egicoccus halophilus]|uniref:tRNA-2-methylthio-N(6)-dimethylallyladenosine synthase n=1 Tax=Egicoccus halophilus TaxID=1670830 RepID=A0A8J3ES61_9ACTN|nr:tRNA (N6-isopentenyl adenosine(37)-C2)-methylthiotransferase MiaB [Egicoccus halophilus]GGI06612.1 tRNA-2-methylthio-N(6)-dimethylallyladenosine synthase [Egicoccus halophilus]